MVTIVVITQFFTFFFIVFEKIQIIPKMNKKYIFDVFASFLAFSVSFQKN
jgi:hypothetical protein